MTSADAWYQEGLSRLGFSRHADTLAEYQGDLEEALAAFEQALALEPAHAGAHGQRGLALARLHRHEEAAAALGKALALAPGDEELTVARAQSLQRSGAPEEALRAWDDALRARPGHPEALFGRAEVLDALGRWGEALAAWDAVLALPHNRAMVIAGQPVVVTTTDFRRVRARLCRACALARSLRTEEAVAAFRELLAAEALHLHGPSQPPELPAALRELVAARVAYRQHLEASRDPRRAWRWAGETWLRAHCPEEALLAWERLIALAPADGDAWFGKAEALAQAGRRAEAVAAYRQALALHPVAVLAVRARLAVVEGELAAERAGG